MTPKEKAKKLYHKFYDSNCMDTYAGEKECAKECALIAVDEIIKSKSLQYLFTKEEINSMDGTSDDIWIYETFTNYWKQVRNEIEKL